LSANAAARTTPGFVRTIERAAAGAGLELNAHPHAAPLDLRLRPP
jgi:hypothetical protein